MMGFFKQILVLCVLAGLGGGVYWYYDTHMAGASEANGPRAQRGPRTVKVETVPAVEKALPLFAEAVGSTRALRAVDIVPLAEGRIIEIDIVPGREVVEGAVLARLDNEIERATLAEAKARIEERRLAMERAESLRQTNTISQANLELLRSELAIAGAELDRAQRRLADRVIRAPFSGILGISSIDLGARVETSTVITTLDDLSEVEIEFRLPETFYGQIRQDQAVTATSAAFPGRFFSGKVAAIDSRVDQTSRSFRVRARLPNPDRALPVGMFMRLEIELSVRSAIVVPEEALQVEGGNIFLYVASEGTAERRTVTAGIRRNGVVEILEGVAAGDVVIHRGIQSLRNGSTIEIIGAPPASSGDGPASPETAAKPHSATRG
ncbi:efflux RND transporter periplasmic adaptor subunit [Roseibium hamelinense]|nr:efflux RND transporter periplasmic adaptor subunit [Roseibium hamelinense]